MKVKAISKRVGVSVIKARVVADTVRGMNANDAVGILTYVSKGAALPVKKTIESAIANARNNYNLNTEVLVISEIRVDKGPMAKFNTKRFITLGKGGYARFDRKYCHITVILDDRSVSNMNTEESVKVIPKADILEAEVVEVKNEKKVAKNVKSTKKASK